MRKPIIIIGAGLAGLAAAWKLKEKAEVFEASDAVGGVARTYKCKGFSYDLGPHVLYFRNLKTQRWVEEILEGRWRRQARRARIVIDGEKVDYPIQEGFLQSDRLKRRFLPDFLKATQCKEGNFKEMAANLYGSALAEDFFIPYNTKLWRYPLEEMDKEWAQRFLPSFPRDDLKRLAKGETLPRGPNAYFFYPEKSGIGTLSQALGKGLRNRIHLSTKVTSINTKEGWVETNSGTRHHYSYLISTIPLPEILRTSVDLPESDRNRAKELRSVGMVFVHLSLAHPLSEDSHWVYFSDPEICFHRISIPRNYSDVMIPPDRGSIVAEVSFPSDKNPDIQTIVEKVKMDTVKSGIVEGLNDITSHDAQVLRYAYVFPTMKGEKAREELRSILREKGILLAGRYGVWEYANMERALEQGIKTAEALC
ncbi:FAD-dependent oxidoreductase [candidate division WOR-3 bacterium]|nr:FAD-dependent oxidoreductase [candidate division WOR-3 bacterium]